MALSDVIDSVRQYDPRYVTVTGGEPLGQPSCLELLSSLCDEGYRVSLETSGALDIGPVDPRVVKVVDLKTPDSGEMHRNRYDNMALLTERDEVKFVICSRRDYDWARAKILEFDLDRRVREVLMSPSFGEMEPATLADWMLHDRLNCRMQLQLHKILWKDSVGR